MVEDIKYDIAVIGSGSAGLTAARTATKLGAETLLVEQRQVLGGDCTNTGCVPSKSLIYTTRVSHATNHASTIGIKCTDVSTDWKAVQAHITNAQSKIYEQDDSEGVLRSEGVHVLSGTTAEFHNNRTLLLRHSQTRSSTTATNEQYVHFKACIICTGAGPAIPNIRGINEVHYFTNETIFTQLTEVPKRLAVIGGGPIGCELSQAFSRLGSEVYIIGRLIPRESDNARSTIERVFEQEKITCINGRAKSVDRKDAQKLILYAQKHSGEPIEIETTDLLVAAGRQPRGIASLKLDLAGVKASSSGITTNKYMQTSQHNIFAAGDCTGAMQFTHLAGFMGAQCAFNAIMPHCVWQIKPEPSETPRCTFTDPEVASVGMNLAEAKAYRRNHRVGVLERPISHNDRAITEASHFGYFRIVHCDGTLIGADIVSPHAGEVISELAVAIRKHASIEDLASTLHPYPAFAFAIQQMCAEYVYNQLQSSRAVGCMQRCFGLSLQSKRQ